MKNNRSLKQLKIQTHRFAEETYNINKTHLILPSSPNIQFNVESITSVLGQFQNGADRHKYLKNHKYTQSQTRLQVPHFTNYQLTSPKFPNTQIKTDRPIEKYQDKGQQNIEVTPFDLGKTYKHQDFTLKILTPANRNVCIEQPKRPKILNKQKQLTFFQQFKLGKVLGKGRFGNVYRAQHNFSKFLVAVKQISLAKVSAKLIQRLIYQIKIQSFIKHEHCLQLYKYYKEGNNLYLVIELGESSLFDRLRQKKYFTEVQSAYYVNQTIKALIYLHSHGIIHRDIKPENIVLINNVVKLADFGWSIYVDNNSKRTTFCGTLDYVSPEIITGSKYDKMVDVWSIGVLCYELCTGNAPFQSTKSRQQTYRKILSVDLKFPKYMSEEVKDFIKKLLQKRPEDRMSLQDALQHAWMKKYLGK